MLLNFNKTSSHYGEVDKTGKMVSAGQ